MGTDESARVPSLRIGQLAELAGTTTRAVRYYHSIGLLKEPERDDSGYRRYGPEHLVVLVRIRRLRTLDMPLEQIAAHVSGAADEPGDLRASLRSLAEDIGRQMEDLEALRQKVLDLAATGVAGPPEVWETALRTRGLLDDAGTLPAGEHAAVNLVDALHPGGIQEVVEQSSSLLGDPTFLERLKPLLERFRTLPDDESAIEDLAREVAPLFPRSGNAPPVDVETMDKLLGSRFTDGQRRFLHRLRQLLEGHEG
jgi:DNA-binding transcriptional MerR regulator